MFNFHCKVFFFALGWYNVDSFVAALLSLLKSLLDKVIFFHLTCPDTEKRLQLPYTCFRCWNVNVALYEGSILLGCKGHNKKRFNTRGKEWNISLQRQTNLKLKCCLIYYNRRYRSVYWLKYHAAGFSSMRVHVQFAHYIKKFELLIWMVNPVLNQLYLK